ncbi:hypothetical protein [Paracoccus sediminicola]|uniref:hypothetical protein n=1 Tax=Paracoccus sediminicola TaxID=3017783 RepID=UPI0022EFE984|nr:hypothetical protein [Paracoccus sediminicola]WBU57181.1 hypothetical protein PAF18_01670 [Paracoccus sediminicola]
MSAGASRTDPAQGAAAQRRARLMAARAVRTHPGLSAKGRLAGRLGQDLAPLNIDDTYDASGLDLVLDRDLAARVFEAAAAALMATRLSRLITSDALAGSGISAEARGFALRHRALSLPDDDTLPDHAKLVGQLAALWASTLPEPFAAEYGGGASLPEMPTAKPGSAPAPRKRRFRLRRAPQVVLGSHGAARQENRFLAALNAAIEALSGSARGEVAA